MIPGAFSLEKIRSDVPWEIPVKESDDNLNRPTSWEDAPVIIVRNSIVVFLAVLAISLGGQAMADLTGTEPAVTFPTNPRTGIGVPQPDGLTVGWSFTLDSPRTATHLGMYNYNFSGQGEFDRQIGLWNSGGSLVTDITIPAGPGGGEIDGPSPLNFIYGELASPELLQAGEVYTLGVWYGFSNSPGLCFDVDPTTMDGLSVATYSLLGPGGGLNRPTGDYSGSYANGFFGPNVRFQIGDPEPPAEPGLISISFDTQVDYNFGGGYTNPIPVGEPDNDVGLQLPGQEGPWNSLLFGNGQVNITFRDTPSITVDGVTFTWNPDEEGYFTYYTPVDDLRGTVAFLRSTGNTSIDWELSGLEPDGEYDLILFGQEESTDGNAVNPADFTILGHDAGNGVGNPVTLDAENDGNFTGVIASSTG
ncbi:MAG: hypothetical protein HQ581_20280, partial [Planctomycetes bacterium]|nr:hypothetical protein [Planctomycetota bacterium]